MAPVAVTSVDKLKELLDADFEWIVAPDSAEGRMSFNLNTDVSLCTLPSHFVSGYTENDDGEITLDNVLDALQIILPTAAVDSNLRLTRHNPMKWPYRGTQKSGTYPNATYKDCWELYARNVRIIPHGSGAGKQLVPYDALRSESPSYIRYEQYQYSVDFRALDYALMEDNAVSTTDIDVEDGGYLARNEYERNCRIRFQPLLDTLTLEGKQMQFAENPDPGVSALTWKGSPFSAPLILNERKGILHVSWLDVPADFVLGANPGLAPGRPRQFERALGCVNKTEIFGCDPQTLLLSEPPEFVSKPFGMFDRTWRMDYVYEWQYDIHMKFKFFDPPAGKVGSLGAGHNLFAPKHQTYYLYATRPLGDQDASNPNNPNIETNPPLFPLFEFRWLFQAADAV